MSFKIHKLNDPVLRKETEIVSDFGVETQKIIDDMIETMRKSNGIGLAAPQVGISKKIIVCEFSPSAETIDETKLPAFPLTILCNPKIEHSSKDECIMVEGCLSFPGLEVQIKRPKEVIVSGLDRYGNNIKIEANKLFARVLQHEIDHLNSILMIDRIEKTPTFFIGTGSLGAPTLAAMAVDPRYDICLVITGDPKNTSRKKHVVLNPIEETAKRLKLPVLKTDNIRDRKVIDKIIATRAKLGIMADFGQIIDKEILDFPEFGVVNIHPSLLPKYRGASPIQQTILDGEKKTGITLIRANEKMDAGGIISQGIASLSGSENATVLKQYFADVAVSLVLNTLPYYLADELKPIDQDENKATFTRQFKKEDGFVDENTKALVVERKIRAFSDWPGVYTIKNNKRIKITSAHFDKNGQFEVDRVQPEGKREMTYDEYVRGRGVKLTFGG